MLLSPSSRSMVVETKKRKEHMIQLRRRTWFLLFSGAWLLACCWMVLFPMTASAHAVLLRSNPSKNALLRNAPERVQMWFSENLNPTLTTAFVVKAVNGMAQRVNDKATHVDLGDAHLVAGTTNEMAVSLKPHLPPALYLV